MPGTKTLLLVMAVILLLLAACGSLTASGQPPDYWPAENWRSAAPAEQGFDESVFAELTDLVASDLPFLDSVLVIRNGTIVYEAYFNGYDANALHDMASVTKSWTSALVGMARAQGELSDLDTPLPDLLPAYFAAGDYADKKEITLRHLLQMRSGIAYNEEVFSMRGNGGEKLLERDTTELALSFPAVYDPGQTWNYTSQDTLLISAVFQQAMGQSLASYAASNLFGPLGIKQFEWPADGVGTTLGGQNLSMAPRDMAKLGFLYLHSGIWNNEQLIPEEWVELSLAPQGGEAYYIPTGRTETIEWYGLHWWTREQEWLRGYRSYQARGFAGQQVLVIPELDLIITTTANLEGVDPGTAQQQEEAIMSLIGDVIFPALTDVDLETQQESRPNEAAQMVD